MADYASLSVDPELDAEVAGFLERHPRGEGWKNKRTLYHRLIERGLRSFTDQLGPAPPSLPPAAPVAAAPEVAPIPAAAPNAATTPRPADPPTRTKKGGRGRTPRAKGTAKDEDDDEPAPPEPEGSWMCAACAETMPWVKRVEHDCPALRRAPAKQQVLAPPPPKKDLDVAPVRAQFVAAYRPSWTRAVQLSTIRGMLRAEAAQQHADLGDDDLADERLDPMREAWIAERTPTPTPAAAPPRSKSYSLTPVMHRLQEFGNRLNDLRRKDPAEAREYAIGLVQRAVHEQGVELTEAEAAEVLAMVKPEAVA